MSFADLVKANLGFIAEHSETPTTTYNGQPVDVVVEENPSDGLDGVLHNTILVLVSKSDVASVTVESDTIVYGGVTYKVLEVLESRPAHYYLKAVK